MVYCTIIAKRNLIPFRVLGGASRVQGLGVWGLGSYDLGHRVLGSQGF